MGTIYGDIRFRRGLEENLPSFPEGQPGFTTDSKRVFIGSADGNVELAKKDSVDLLGGRLDEVDLSLAESTNDLLWRGINIKIPFGTSLTPAKGDGVTDDTQAFKDFASQYPYIPLIIPDGDYIIKDTINLNCNMIQGLGNARLIFDDPIGKDGLSFDPTYQNKVAGVKGLQIVCRTSNGGSAIKTPQDATEYTQNYTKFEFEYLTLSGATNPTTPLSYETMESWAVCLDIGDSWGVGIREVYGRGNYRIDQDVTGQLQSIFIKLHAVNTGLTVHIDGFTCAAFYRPIDLGDRVFFDIVHGDITHSYYGVYESGTTIFNESRLQSVNINSQLKGVYMHNASNRVVDKVTVRRHKYGMKTPTGTWYGFHFANCTSLNLTGCFAQPDESNGAFSSSHVAYYLDATNLSSLNGIGIGSGIDQGLFLNNITGNTIDNVVTQQNQASDIVYNLTANARSSVFGKLTKVSTFTGTVFTKDGTIGTTNTQTSTTTV